jgi:hypothetical protein
VTNIGSQEIAHHKAREATESPTILLAGINGEHSGVGKKGTRVVALQFLLQRRRLIEQFLGFTQFRAKRLLHFRHFAYKRPRLSFQN